LFESKTYRKTSLDMKEVATTFHKVYDRIAHGYDLAFGPLLRHGQKMAMNAMDIKPQHKVLEVGIGTGLTLPLYKKDQVIDGLDLSESMLAKAEKRVQSLGMKNVKLHIMSAENLKFADNTFDVVFAPSVFSVVNDPAKVLNEMIRVVRPEGTLCIVSHFAGSKYSEKMIDKLSDPLTRKLVGFRMTTPRQIVEGHSNVQILLKKTIFFLNFGTLYLLKKKS
jgi:phosphatidylethanolamine/phosphatidyl-N-methylethanolamine N-methyltransferase